MSKKTEPKQPKGYQTPPKPLVDLVDAPSTPEVFISPNNKLFAIAEKQNHPSIKQLAQRELRIGGLRIHPKSNTASRESYYKSLTILSLETKKSVIVTSNSLPQDPNISRVSWSPKGDKIGFTITESTGVSLWVADAKTGIAHKLVYGNVGENYILLNGCLQCCTYAWITNDELVAKIRLPDEVRGKEPKKAISYKITPVIQENKGGTSKPAWSYQDLLKNPYDELLFQYYLRAQVVLIKLIDGGDSVQVQKLGKPGLIYQILPSPNGEYLIVSQLHKPFSYVVKYKRFPKKVEIWNRKGEVIRKIADLPLAESVPIHRDSCRKGPRHVSWRRDKPATVIWVEAQDDGDPNKQVEGDIREKIYILEEPFNESEPSLFFPLKYRYQKIYWGLDDLCIVSSRWSTTKTAKYWIVNPSAKEPKGTVLYEYSYEDRYLHPGFPITMFTSYGTRTLAVNRKGDKRFIYFRGHGGTSQGDRPFLDVLDLSDLSRQRLWRSEPPYYEYVTRILDVEAKRIILRRESVSTPPNYYIKDLETGELEQVTKFPHPHPFMEGVQKKLIKYKREDGVQLSGLLYLPKDYDPASGKKLPLLIWAYPRDYKSRKAAAQVKDSPYKFMTFDPVTPLVYLAVGYAILHGPTMPIIGDNGNEPNDTYLKQLVASAKAAVDEVVRLGVTTRDQIAVGGHSYGAFMVGNLLAHTKGLFAAGIARNGCYNRTLTPFGFQYEMRSFWQAREVYNKISPFNYANKITTPLLLIHGAADNNTGTYPMQSKRMYHALKGHGATCRLVLFPYESHRFKARETILHLLWEQYKWLEKFVNKQKKPKETVVKPEMKHMHLLSITTSPRKQKTQILKEKENEDETKMQSDSSQKKISADMLTTDEKSTKIEEVSNGNKLTASQTDKQSC